MAQLSSRESPTLELTSLAMREKSLMVAVGQQLLELAKAEDFNAKIDALAFQKRGLELVEHLSNFAGFLDKDAQEGVKIVVRYMTALIVDPNSLFAKTQLKLILPLAIGIRVDFTKKPPFKTIGFDVNALGAQLKAFVKR